MKSTLAPIAAAVGLALFAASANAQTFGTTAPGGNPAGSTNGMFLAIWNPNGTDSEVVNLSYAYNDITHSTGLLTPNSAGGAFSLATDPSSGAGQVLQINFGTVANWATNFGSEAGSGSLDYGVYAANAFINNGTPQGAAVTATSKPTATKAGETTVGNGISGEVATWQGDQTLKNEGQVYDKTGSTAVSVQNGLLVSGSFNSSTTFGGSVGTALSFYDMVISGSKNVITQYANAAGNGFWFLSSSGDLTWNVPTTSSVPLPAAAWLFASGLAGLAGIARRRRAIA